MLGLEAVKNMGGWSLGLIDPYGLLSGSL
jgi:hypothetical protein